MSRDTNVIPMGLISGICNTSQGVADQVQALSEQIRNGEWGNVRVACLIMDTDNGVGRATVGPAGTCKLEVVGLLTYAINNCING